VRSTNENGNPCVASGNENIRQTIDGNQDDNEYDYGDDESDSSDSDLSLRDADTDAQFENETQSGMVIPANLDHLTPTIQ
jgi:hypothetical protein